MLSGTEGCMLFGKLGFNFFSTSERLHSNIKNRQRLIRARIKFHLVNDNPNVSLGIVDCSHTLVVLLSGMIITRNEWTCLPILLWSSTIWKFLQRLASFLPHKTIPSKEKFSARRQFVGLPLQLIQTLHSMDCTLKIHSVTNNLISDKLEYSEVVNHFWTLMLLKILAHTLQK